MPCALTSIPVTRQPTVAAADFEYVACCTDLQHARDLRQFSLADPAGLAEIDAISFAANLGIHVDFAVAVGSVVQIYFFSHEYPPSRSPVEQASACGFWLYQELTRTG